ncbi:hypothetical protein SAMN00120144_3601 [Hymenobacter roseosalivarius DSM 11622]|uniref:Uncharacterized protein n=1 Tax=Hymenobacter roseosalivarius DSM 11622 TaxID=645990 RepID=A0A1W1W2Z6_9BACT|nr:hypothetical protein SAMN00120144_3601 [Hymenobacter roseosalivarius DSM 11622]
MTIKVSRSRFVGVQLDLKALPYMHSAINKVDKQAVVV